MVAIRASNRKAIGPTVEEKSSDFLFPSMLVSLTEKNTSVILSGLKYNITFLSSKMLLMLAQ